MDNAKFNDESSTLSTGAEYVLTRTDGKTVVITDETYGFGVITYECEVGVNCQGTAITTDTTPTTSNTPVFSTATTKPGTTPSGSTPTVSSPGMLLLSFLYLFRIIYVV